MKIAIIGDSSMLYMPYVSNYEKILIENKVDYNIINWDRLQLEDNHNEFIFRDNKIGHRRNYYDYIKYSHFIKMKLKENNYDRLIICGIPLSHVLRKYLLKQFKGKYVIDIRDYHRLLKVINITNVIKESSFTTISSPAYREWLPKIDKYVLNHNMNVTTLYNLHDTKFNQSKRIIISYIGSLANYEENRDFINSLKNAKKFLLLFHGDGTINNLLDNYIKKFNIDNVRIYGRYNREMERDLYLESDLINMILYNRNINNKTCLSNRLYNSVLHGKPIIVFNGTYIAKLVERYNLGLVINSFDKVEDKINEYLQNFNYDLYESGRNLFFSSIVKDNNKFRDKVQEFLN